MTNEETRSKLQELATYVCDDHESYEADCPRCRDGFSVAVAAYALGQQSGAEQQRETLREIHSLLKTADEQDAYDRELDRCLREALKIAAAAIRSQGG